MLAQELSMELLKLPHIHVLMRMMLKKGNKHIKLDGVVKCIKH